MENRLCCVVKALWLCKCGERVCEEHHEGIVDQVMKSTHMTSDPWDEHNRLYKKLTGCTCAFPAHKEFGEFIPHNINYEK